MKSLAILTGYLFVGFAAARALLPTIARMLRRPLLPVSSEAEASRSPWQYSIEPGSNVYTTSALGIINGMLPKVGVVLLSHWDADTGIPVRPYFSLRRPWWGK